MPPRPLLILGCTASGKSELAVGLAGRLGGEVISADSMQVYKCMDAGTAKPTPEQRRRVPHHLVDIVEPTEAFSTANWVRRAETLIPALQAQNKVPVLVGGTNLYLKSLLEGLFDGPGQDPAFRAGLEGVPTPELHLRLKACDPAAGAKIGINDRQRIMRALEVFHLTGTPISVLQAQWQATPKPYRFDPVLIGLEWPTEQINARINLRVKAMFHPENVDEQLARDVCIGGESLPKEVMRLNSLGCFAPLREGNVDMPNLAREALGYKQVLAALNGGDPLIRSMEDAFERTQALTRQYAKQQRTWLKRFAGLRAIACAGKTKAEILGAALALAGG